MAEPLDPLTLPLRGTRLIEASAGTGKTWTIAALYLRLVLGHGAPGQAHAPALRPEQILVMTFTKAATRELSGRIRQRLVQAAACFRGEAEPAADDGFLSALMQAYPAGEARRAAAWRLATAAESMDDAAVCTIDAWCQRMLREHAFDSGCLFDEQLQADTSALQAEAVRDYWRQHVYPLSDAALATVLAQWKDVGALAAPMRASSELTLPAAAGDGPLADVIAHAVALRSAARASLQSGWIEQVDEMSAWLEAQWARRDSPIDKQRLGPANGRRWLAELRRWLTDPAETPLVLNKGADRLTGDGVRDALKPGAAVDVPPVFDRLKALLDALPALPDAGTAVREHAAVRVAERLRQLKAQAGTYGFIDMLERLDAALNPAAGASAARLRQRILAQHPVALVDEFQDTSPLQLSIFDRLYGVADDDADRALLLIGDPKQSIYGFRGADIHSYLQARRATQGRHHALGTNHRSTPSLVGAVNHLFGAAETRAGDGAFRFGVDRLPFVAVAAKGRADRFVTRHGEPVAITVALDTAGATARDNRERHAAWCAEQIVSLLNDPAAGFVPADRPFERLRPADIAVLVRTRTEAAAMRHALGRRGVASVYLSDQDSVFGSVEAQDLLRLLQALAAPRNARLAHAALATRLLARRVDELVALASSDDHFDAACETLRQLAQSWSSHGVLAAMRAALHAFDLPSRWLAADAERTLTNALHLAELLQRASAEVGGEQALIRWLAQQIDDAQAGQGADDERVQRLESDADLVQIITVHKSKGLEFALVFLPFAAHFRAVQRNAAAVLHLPDADGRRRVVLSPTAAQLAQAELERQREDLRLLYVALTRARHALWVGAAALRVGPGDGCVWHRSAIGYLVSGTAVRSAQQVGDDVIAAASGCAGIRVETLDGDAACTPLAPRRAPAALQPALPYGGRFDRGWSIGSYSALVRDAARAAGAPVEDLRARVLRDDEPAEPAAVEPAPPRAPGDAPWHRFPRGAFAGNFLHDQLEWLATEGFALDGSAAVQQALLRRCERQGWGHRGDDVLAWLRQVCRTPLPPLDAPLSGLDRTIAEMEFWLPNPGLVAIDVDALCRRHVLPGEARPPLPERTLHGMLMGFIDLVVEHQGRYWVLDYKSNTLGPHDDDYGPAAMRAALLAHRYDTQAVLYLLALHRLLKQRLGAGYDASRHLGGAVFVFLRGIHGSAHGCLPVSPPVALIEALDAMLSPAVGVAPGALA